MDSLFYMAADAGEWLFQVAWLPVLIWTIFGTAVWLVFSLSNQIHPEYQYHSRLAVILSLPAGFLFLALIHQISAMVSVPDSTAGYHFITLSAPFEIQVSPGQESTGLSLLSILYAGFFLVFIGGLITSLGKFLYQCIQLRWFRNRCGLTDIQKNMHISSANKALANTAQKPVKIAFLPSEIVPVTFGIRQPVVLLPQTLLNNPTKLNIAVRHELTHIIQNDFITHLFVNITKALFWFHPLIHTLSRELIEYREMRCDYKVLHGESVSKKEYAMLLLELIPMPNIDKTLSVNMAQESSNLKKRITMITQQSHKKPIPVKSSFALLGAIFISTAIAMACTDMQTQHVFDEEELNLMTDMDRTGERGHHQVIIYMGDEEQADRYSNALDRLRTLEPEHIQSVDVLRGEDAISQYGDRASKGVIVVRTNMEWESYNTTLKALGMNPQAPPTPPVPPVPPAPTEPDAKEDDYFVVVEKMPELIGGLTSIMQDIRYPEEARAAGIEGRVAVQFIVNEEGDVEDAKIIRGIGYGADKEALRVVEQAKFKPGMQRGEPVKVQYSLPIFFRLQESESTQ